jgi:hypothetical protein
MIGLLRFVRVVLYVLAALFAVGAFGYFRDLGDPKYNQGVILGTALTYLAFAALFAVLTRALFPLIHKLHNKRHGNPHPALKTQWSM